MKATGTFTVQKWEEETIAQISPEKKMTRATVEYKWSGGIEGKAAVEYLMFYKHFDETDQHKASASYVALIRFEGTVSGASGGFILEDHGTFEGGTASSTLQVVEGSGTGSLGGIRGKGNYQANQDGYRFELEYTI